MDFFLEPFSFNAFYLISVGVFLMQTLSLILFRLTKRKLMPMYSAILIALIVSFYHLAVAEVEWSLKNIMIAVFFSILMYIPFVAVTSGISSIARSTIDTKLTDLIFGKRAKSK